MSILTYLPIIVMGMLVLFLVLPILRMIFVGGQQLSSQIFGFYAQIIFLRLRILLSAVLILGIALLIVLGKLEISQTPIQSGLGQVNFFERLAGPRYAAGDAYELEGQTYRLVDKATYRMDNLAGRVPEVTLNGVEYYLVRKPS